MSGWTGAWRGFQLALLNLIVIAIWIGIREHDLGSAPIVMVYGCVPAIVTGCILGALVSQFPHAPAFARLPVLVVPSFAVVMMLGEAFLMKQYIPGAMLPTVLCCVALERWTFKEVEKSELPTARVA